MDGSIRTEGDPLTVVNVTPNQSRGRGLPAMPPGSPIAAYRTYEQAQRAVDYLSDNRFPVQFVSIVGNDLKMVERVTGRLTYSRVAIAGLLSGAYWGVFLGVLFSLFGGRTMGSTVPAMGALGAGFGLIFGLVSYAATGGRRDFTSTSQIVAAEYAVWCAEDHIAAARQMLERLPDDHRLPDNGSRQGPPPVLSDRPQSGPYPPVPPQSWPQPGPGGPMHPGHPGPGPDQTGSRLPAGGGAYPPPPAGQWHPGEGGPGAAPDPSQWQPAPGGGQATVPSGQGQPAPGHPDAGPDGGAHPVGGEPAGQPPVSGPTYSEMMERRRQERSAAERDSSPEDPRS